jgi:hypothetical protein
MAPQLIWIVRQISNFAQYPDFVIDFKELRGLAEESFCP